MARQLSLGLKHAPFLLSRKQKLSEGQGMEDYRSEGAGETMLLCPDVGTLTDVAPLGCYLEAGDDVARLHQLGQAVLLRVPEGVSGYVVASCLESGASVQSLAKLQYESPIVVLNAQVGVMGTQDGDGPNASAQSQAGSVLPSPSSGRFYRRPSPDKDPFVKVGQIIEAGNTVGLLEIMKTFARVQFQGPKVPAKAKIVEILADDDDELSAGDPILRFEAVDS